MLETYFDRPLFIDYPEWENVTGWNDQLMETDQAEGPGLEANRVGHTEIRQTISHHLVKAIWGKGIRCDRAVHPENPQFNSVLSDSDDFTGSSASEDESLADEDDEIKDIKEIYDVPTEEWDPNKYKETGWLTARDTIDLAFVKQSVRLGVYLLAIFANYV